MNKNLKRLLKWAETNIPRDQFDMEVFREGQEQTPKCDSVGCMVGWATGAFPKDFEDDTYRDFVGDIKFRRWSRDKFDLSINEWEFLFSPYWIDIDNTLEGALARIRYLLKKGRVPKSFDRHVTATFLPEKYRKFLTK